MECETAAPCRSSAVLQRVLPTLRRKAITIEHVNQIAHRALQRVRESEQRREAGDGHAALEIADERMIRFATLRELFLSEAARDSEVAKVRAENFAFRSAL